MTHKNEQAEVSQLKHARRQHYTGKLTVNTQTTDETTANHSRTGTGHTNSTTGLKCQNWANTRLVFWGRGLSRKNVTSMRTYLWLLEITDTGYDRRRVDVTEVKPYILAMEILETGMDCIIVLSDRSWANYWLHKQIHLATFFPGCE